MGAIKRYAAWDVATLARFDQDAKRPLLVQARVRLPGWANFGLGWGTIFEPRWRRWVRLTLWVLGVGLYLVGLFALALWDPGGKAGGTIGFAFLSGLGWAGVLYWALMRKDPALLTIRRWRIQRPARIFSRARSGRLEAGALEALGSEVLARREAWLARRTKPVGHGARSRLMWSYPPALVYFVGGMMAVPLYLAFGSRPGGFRAGYLGCAVPLVQLGGMMIGLWLPARLLRRLDVAAREGVCPDCGYDLVSVPGALDKERTGQVPIGPRRCPECASPWPLVPPPCA